MQDGARELRRIESARGSSCILKEGRCIAALSQSYLFLACKSRAMLAWPARTAGRVTADAERAKSISHLSRSYRWGGSAKHRGCDGTLGGSQYWGVRSASGKQLHKSPAESSEQKVMLTFPPVGARPIEGLILPSHWHGPAGLEQDGLGSPR